MHIFFVQETTAIIYRWKLKYGWNFGLGHCGDWPASQILGLKSLKSIRSVILSYFSLDNPPIFIIYRYKLIMLTFINPPIIWICAIGSNIGVKMNIFCVTPQVMAGWDIFWECSMPSKPIRLFLRVNKEGLCHPTKIWVEFFWVI